jgi:hypothetical protein
MRTLHAKLCPKCHADWLAVQICLNSEELENKELAAAIIENCSECKKHFTGEKK